MTWCVAGDGEDQANNRGTQRALQTVHRVDRLTRTLQRRLTKRTIAQVTTIRHHAMQAVVAILDLTKTVGLKNYLKSDK